MYDAAVGLSGGVDSAAAAYLLISRGYRTAGVTFKLFDGQKTGSPPVSDAANIAAQLGIPLYTIDGRELFAGQVKAYFTQAYAAGITPNPCAVCNPKVKFKLLAETAGRLGARYIATGHYARIVCESNRYAVGTAACAEKDQSYFLYALTQEQLSRAIFPLGGYTKKETRAIAQEAGLSVADKGDSQDICFIPGGDYVGFLRESGRDGDNTGFIPGDFVDESGKILGRHSGIACYTIGQRKGLKIALGWPAYVKSIDAADNKVVLAEESGLYTKKCTIGGVCFMAVSEINCSMRLMGKLRNTRRTAASTVSYEPETGRLVCEFDEPQRAVTPGQSAVFYDSGGRIVCGGFILGHG